MRICLIGSFQGNPDEGMKKVTLHLSRELSKRHEVLPLKIKSLFSVTSWKQIKDFKPEIVHYVHGPSFKSFLIVKAISTYYRRAKTVMSATHPAPSSHDSHRGRRFFQGRGQAGAAGYQ